MSRSRKKIPGFTDCSRRKYRKTYIKIMNRRVRKADAFSETTWLKNGGSYKKLIEVYDVWGGLFFRWYTEKPEQISKDYSVYEDRPYKTWIK